MSAQMMDIHEIVRKWNELEADDEGKVVAGRRCLVRTPELVSLPHTLALRFKLWHMTPASVG